jgi:hypothetical protein
LYCKRSKEQKKGRIMEKEYKILDKIGNKNPFTVPDNYFEDFAVNIQKKISEQELSTEKENKKSAKTLPFVQKLKPFLYAAASLALIFVAGDYLTMKTQSPSQDFMPLVETTTISVSEEDKRMDLLLSYIDENALIDYLYDNKH